MAEQEIPAEPIGGGPFHEPTHRVEVAEAVAESEEVPQIVDFTEDTLEVIEPGETEPTTFVEAEVVKEAKPKGKAKK